MSEPGPFHPLPLFMPPSSGRSTLYVDGRFLHNRTGNLVILRGVNLPLCDDWDNFPGRAHIDDVAQTGANCLRIEWYKDVRPDRTQPYTVADLASFLDLCIAANIIPIVSLFDFTGQGVDRLQEAAQYWTQSAPGDPANDVFGMLKQREEYLIVNIANEVGNYRWADDSVAALQAYVQAYATVIGQLRAAGLNMPLMIDAPDSGISLAAFIERGADLVAADPLRNVLLSVHAYWAGTDDSAYMPAVIEKNLPIVFGEIANKQGNAGDPVIYDLDGLSDYTPPPTGFTYQNLLPLLHKSGIGWLAWCWSKDGIEQRQLSEDGTFAGLTTWGNDLVNNTAYGYKSTAIRVAP